MPLPPPASPGIPLDEVDTPALLVDSGRARGHIGAWRKPSRAAGAPASSSKSHKCSEIARRQVAAGAVGVCSQKVSEAEAAGRGRRRRVLVTTRSWARRRSRARAPRARGQGPRCSPTTRANVAELDAAARSSACGWTCSSRSTSVRIAAAIERVGPALALAGAIRGCRNLAPRRLHAYHGARSMCAPPRAPPPQSPPRRRSADDEDPDRESRHGC